ncbi:MAG: hypothetical protein MI757_23145 [Pirellulales bacterium]|nr:hypothetical protein [Pirellulales bacterium]
MNAGDTFLIEEPGTSLDSHLWIVLSDPDIDPHSVLLVNFTSFREDKDQACIVDPHEHGYLSKKSCVNYQKAKVVGVVDLDNLLTNKLIKKHDPLSAELLQKIRDGASNSKYIEFGAWEMLASQGLVPE